MRQSLLHSFSKILVRDLHGNLRQKEAEGATLNDDNVFDIQQGVVVTLAIGGGRADRLAQTFFSELWGTRNDKYRQLASSLSGSIEWRRLGLAEPFFLFVAQDDVTRAEYSRWPSLADAFICFGSGIKTDRDELCLDSDRSRLSDRMRTLFSGKYDSQFVEQFNVRQSSSYNIIELARRTQFSEADLTLCLYRPFDVRWLYYKRGFTSRPAWEVMQHMRPGDNIGLLSARTNKSAGMDHFFCTRLLTEVKVAESTTQSCVFPLYLVHDAGGLRLGKHRTLNFTPSFLKAISATLALPQVGPAALPKELSGEEVVHCAYALFFSPTYRNRYAEFLKIDFPRIPLPRNVELFRSLARLGGELVALHLLESPKLKDFITTYAGPKRPEVGRVGWSEKTVWLDAAATKKGQPATPGTIGFRGVPEEVWNFHIGGYQVCEKWLKDRKDRTLTADDITHYHRIVIALHETIRLMREIDEVIDAHGGWPGAFQAADAAQEPTERFLKVAESPAEYGSGKGKGKQ